MRRPFIFPVIMCAAALASGASAQTAHDHAAMHGQNGAGPAATVLTEPGQGAFAAIAEVVALLRSDPQTDWARVDIAGLRRHLVDMDNLVTLSEVVETPVENGVEMRVSLAGRGGDAASRMVPAHAPVLAAETGWTSTVAKDDDALIWRVSAPGAEAEIRALGFYGLMAVGDHHRAHHLAMARGGSMH